MFVFNLIMFISMCLIISILYLTLKGVGELKSDGMLVGVKIPLSQRENPVVTAVQESFPRRLKHWVSSSACIPLVCFFVPSFSISFSIWMLWIIEIIFAFWIPIAVENKRLMKTIREEHWENEFDEEQNHWHWGLVYYNPGDPRSTINNRVGTGCTVNLAKTSGKVLTGIGIAGLLILPVACVWIILIEFMPLTLTVADQKLVAHQIVNDYEIPLEDITEVTLVEELPKMSKTNGEVMDNVQKGSYHIRNVGDCKVFANPNNTVFLELTTQETTYYLSAATDEETQAVYELIEE